MLAAKNNLFNNFYREQMEKNQEPIKVITTTNQLPHKKNLSD